MSVELTRASVAHIRTEQLNNKYVENMKHEVRTARFASTPLSGGAENQLRQMGMSAAGIKQISSQQSVTDKKDLQIIAVLVGLMLG